MTACAFSLDDLEAAGNATREPVLAAAEDAMRRAQVLPPVEVAVEYLTAKVPGLRPDQAREIAARRLAPKAVVAQRREVFPSLDTDDLFADCPVVRDHIRLTADDLGCARAPAALIVLFLASVAAADRLRIDVNGRWRPMAHFFGLPLMPSGKFKTGLLSALGLDPSNTDLLSEFAAWVNRPLIAPATTDAGQRSKAAQQVAADDPEVQARAVERLEQRPLYRATIDCSDSNADSLLKAANESGFVVMVRDELRSTLDRFLGTKNRDGNVDPLKQGFSGSGGNVVRVGRGAWAPRYPDLHMSMLWFTQPEMLSGRNADDRARLAKVADEGLWARFVVAMYEGRQPEVKHPREALQAAQDSYFQHMRRMLLTDAGGDHRLAPRRGVDIPGGGVRYVFDGKWLRLSPDAERIGLAFQAELKSWDEDENGVPGRWAASRFLRPSASRIGELAIRVAGLVAFLRTGTPAEDIEVTATDMERSIRAFRTFFIPHYERFVEKCERSDLEEMAWLVYDLLSNQGAMIETELCKLSVPGAKEFNKQSFKDRHVPLREALEWLERAGLVAREQPERKRSGGKPPAVTWHPLTPHLLGRPQEVTP